MRGSFIIILLSIGFFLLSALAEGANWKLITTDEEDNTSIHIDTESIRHISKTVVRAWIKKVYKKPVSKDSKELVEILGYEEYDCEEMKKHTFQLSFRFSDGTSDSMTNPNPVKDWKYITPDTLASAIHDYLCKKSNF